MNTSFFGVAGRDARAKYIPADGWIQGRNGLWEYVSADAPSYVVNVPDRDAELMSVGTKVRWYQPALGYSIITAVGASANGMTPITLYAGTDYTMTAGVGIDKPYFSPSRAPYGFPMNPDKWTQTKTDTGNAAKASPTTNTWYGGSGLSTTGISIVAPIGAWYPQIKALIEIVTPATAGAYGPRATFSSGNSSESDASYTFQFVSQQPATAGTFRGTYIAPQYVFVITSKTTYYIDIFTGQSSVTSISMRGDVATTTIKLVCAYL